MVVRLHDNKTYHVEGVHLASESVSGMLKQARELKDQQARARKLDKWFKRDIGNTVVTLADSLRIGNCQAGTMIFAVKRLGLRGVAALGFEDTKRAAHLLAVPARAALYSGDPRAEKAALAAWERECLVQI